MMMMMVMKLIIIIIYNKIGPYKLFPISYLRSYTEHTEIKLHLPLDVKIRLGYVQ